MIGRRPGATKTVAATRILRGDVVEPLSVVDSVRFTADVAVGRRQTCRRRLTVAHGRSVDTSSTSPAADGPLSAGVTRPRGRADIDVTGPVSSRWTSADAAASAASVFEHVNRTTSVPTSSAPADRLRRRRPDSSERRAGCVHDEAEFGVERFR